MPASARLALFLDVEASSLDGGYPVEVAWCSADLTRGATYLVRPSPDWRAGLAWSDDAQSLHGLTLERLADEGMPPDEVARRLADDLGGRRVESDNPRADAHWLAMLYDTLPFTLCRTRPPGRPAMTINSRLQPHRALDDAVTLAMSFISFDVADGDRLPAEEAVARGRALVEKAGRR